MVKRHSISSAAMLKNRLHIFYCPFSRTLNQIVLKQTIFVSDVKYPKVPNWTTFFQSSVSRVLLTLVGSPPSPHPGNANDPNRSVDTVPVSDKPVPKPQMNSPVMNGKHVYRPSPPPPQSSLRGKRFCARLSRKLGREQRRGIKRDWRVSSSPARLPL